MEPSTLPSSSLALLVFAIAFLYSSVGFGGGSGYLAAMSLFAISSQLMASTTLALNILVAGAAFLAYLTAGHFSARLLGPFLLTSVPAAFLGGYLRVEEQIYLLLLYLALAYIGVRLLLTSDEAQDSNHVLSFSWPIVLLSGLGIGLLAGIVGLGGGIFLAPLIVLTGWGTPKQAAAAAAGFIVVISASGLLGRIVGDNFVFGLLGLALLPLGLVGGLLGSRLGARYLSGQTLRRILGIVMLLAVVRYAASFWS